LDLCERNARPRLIPLHCDGEPRTYAQAESAARSVDRFHAHRFLPIPFTQVIDYDFFRL
jgi:hypothetical protein